MNGTIEDRVKDIVANIEDAAVRSGRRPGEVRILAATKNRSAVEVGLAARAGVRLAGENRVQEFLDKRAGVEEELEWHFIGHLQRNKVRRLVGEVELIHSLDSVRLMREIDKRAKAMGVVQPVLIQVNVAGEESKFGFAPRELSGLLEEAGRMGALSFDGLSTVAPYAREPEEVRWVFSALRDLGSKLEAESGVFDRMELSMGMTGDYPVAVEEGSTIVRLGTAIFGDVET